MSVVNVGKGAASIVGSTLGKEFGLNVGLNKLMGSSWGQAVGTAVRDTAFMAIAPGAFWGITAAKMLAPLPGAIYRGGKGLQDRYNQQRKALSQPTFSYQDTQQAVTMRQAAVQAIQGSKLNARNALGGEASLMHRSYRNGRYN